jgi:hypothetical protein
MSWFIKQLAIAFGYNKYKLISSFPKVLKDIGKLQAFTDGQLSM